MAQDNIDRLDIEINVSGNAEQVFKGLNSTLENLQATLDRISGSLDGISSKVGQETAGINSGISTISKSANDATRNIDDFGKTAPKRIKEVTRSVNKSTGAFGKLFSSIKRIALYRLIRSAIKAITNAFREGVNALVEWEYATNRVNNGSLTITLSNITSELEKIKFNLGAVAGELIQAIEPVLMTIFQITNHIIERVSELIAYLSGKSTYRVANPDYWKQYGQEVDNTTEKINEAKDAQLGFDELNVVDQPSISGGIKAAMGGDADLRFIEKEVDGLRAWQTILGIGGGLGLIGLISLLAGAMRRKNRILGIQTDKTGKEVAALKKLVPVVALAAAAVGVFGGALDGIKFPNIEWEPLPEATRQRIFASVKEFGTSVAISLASPFGTVLNFLLGQYIDVDFKKIFTEDIPRIVSTGNLSISNAVTIMLEVIKRALDKIPQTFKYPLEGAFNSIKSFIDKTNEKLKNFFGGSFNSIKSFMDRTNEKLRSYLGGILDKVGGFFLSLPIKIYRFKDSVISAFRNAFSGITSGAAAGIFGGSLFSLLPMFAFASGGYPTVGDLFIANEAGPELVGTIGGKPAVASNNEITGISNAVYDTAAEQNALLREQNSLLAQILATSGVSLDGKTLKKSIDKANRNSGATIGTSGIVFG